MFLLPISILPSPIAPEIDPGQYVLTAMMCCRPGNFPMPGPMRLPVEQWVWQGCVSLRYLPEEHFTKSRPRSLRSAAIKNLFYGRKNISADVDAIASARVIGCCWRPGPRLAYSRSIG